MPDYLGLKVAIYHCSFNYCPQLPVKPLPWWICSWNYTKMVSGFHLLSQPFATNSLKTMLHASKLLGAKAVTLHKTPHHATASFPWSCCLWQPHCPSRTECQYLHQAITMQSVHLLVLQANGLVSIVAQGSVRLCTLMWDHCVGAAHIFMCWRTLNSTICKLK